MKTFHFVALLLWSTFIHALLAENTDDYLRYDIPADVKKFGPGTSRNPKETYYNFVLPGKPGVGQPEWNRIADETYYDGILIKRRLYKDGVQHGVQRTWHRNGHPASESPYKNGVMHGTFRHWNEVGQLIAQYRITNGKGTRKIYDSQGRLIEEREIEKSLGNGRWMNLSNSDGILSLYWQKDESVVGNTFAFYPTDRLESVKCLSLDGISHGPQIEFSTDGAVTRTKWFVNRKEVTRSEYATAVVSDPSLPAYYADAKKYKELVDAEVKALLEEYRKLPRVKIPLEFDQAGNPVLAR